MTWASPSLTAQALRGWLLPCQPPHFTKSSHPLHVLPGSRLRPALPGAISTARSKQVQLEFERESAAAQERGEACETAAPQLCLCSASYGCGSLILVPMGAPPWIWS